MAPGLHSDSSATRRRRVVSSERLKRDRRNSCHACCRMALILRRSRLRAQSLTSTCYVGAPVGRHHAMQRAGAAPMFGSVPKPASSDFAVLSQTASSVTLTRAVAIPGGADQWGGMAVRTSTGGVSSIGTPTSGTTCLVSALSSGVEYQMRCAWYKGTQRVSEWSAYQLAVTS